MGNHEELSDKTRIIADIDNLLNSVGYPTTHKSLLFNPTQKSLAKYELDDK